MLKLQQIQYSHLLKQRLKIKSQKAGTTDDYCNRTPSSQKQKQADDKAKVVAAVWGTYLNAALQPFNSKDDLKENILEEHSSVWCGVNKMVINFSEASILPIVRSSIHPFLPIILGLNLWYGKEWSKFRPPNSSDDLCLHEQT